MKADKKYIYPSGTNAKKTAEEVFRSHCLGSAGCVVWTGKLFLNGYGCFYYKGKYLLAHRVSYEWNHEQSLTKSDVICHSCDNRKCISPEHLIKGDQQLNINDMMAKGRNNQAKGEKQGHSKLKYQDVEEIKRLRYKENMKLSDIAKIFGVSGKQISVVSRGVQWKTKET